MRFGVLGPLVATDGRGEVGLKGPRHRAVLARLLIARGRVVPVERLVDDLWERPPEGAVGAVQTFVGALRRAVEPDRAPREPARLLVTVARGYALRADVVDAWEFEAAVTAARELIDTHRPDAALPHVDSALALWRGPAYAEFAEEGWARGEIARLTELRLRARELRAEALLALGRAAEAIPDLEAQVREHPLRENGFRLLALAHYRSGRQGDALAVLRTAREVLADELGIDPGPALRDLEADILAQAPRLEPSVPKPVARPLVGRHAELAELEEAAARSRLVLISGDAGVGKTALTEEFAARLAARGWTTAWGGNPAEEGLPPAWAWTRILATLADAGYGAAPTADQGVVDPVSARWRWHRAVASYLAGAAPLLLVFDDLHWAGEETLALLTSVLAEPGGGPSLIVATYRGTDLPAPLADFLGRAARAEPTRIYLAGLPETEIADLVRATTGEDVGRETARVIHRRTGGNAFFVRELARLLAAEGPAALDAVPPGVRDVVRHRVQALPEAVRVVVRHAAVIGTDIDLDVLEALTGGTALDAVESAAQHGFLTETAPHRFRFAHALVRDTLYHDLSRSRRARTHGEIAEALESLRPEDVDALAHHFVLSGRHTDRAAHYARAAAERAESRFASTEAAKLWDAALTAYDRSGASGPETRLELIMGKARASAVSGGLGQARRHRAEALELAEKLDDPLLTARVIGAFDVPAIWTESDDPALAFRITAAVERTLAALPADREADRCRLLATLAVELRNAGGRRAREAAEEAEALARRLGDPALLAFALNARFLQSFDRAGLAPRRAEIGEELVDLAARHRLVTFEVLGHLVLLQAKSALAEFAAADRHAASADELGERYGTPLVGVFTRWYRAMRTAMTGPGGEAAYRAAAAGLAGTSMSGVDNGILALALFCDRLQRGLPREAREESYGSYECWCRPVLPIPDSPRDLLYEARTCLHAVVALELGDRTAMERLYAELLPADGEIAGAGSAMLTLRPVAHYLGDLAAALGRHAAAAAHYRRAHAIAVKAGSPHWAAAARQASDL
ncbi:BTAD domain-containing putative transcriptional regulator [Amycolatopsis regifaucium]|uniref:SARP family transcriptional regulator n=1 Tax=Amycolatopsis regifaucium TaxID=546365 RepID=A0A154M5Y4_9PSEU|nr:BTAD domain-containing putative transcriptional regulator [Amycolatopsis regifaucium]KZB79840.1 SARP family transcriptional regulator [Amycolatopsis regifaucium]OKA10063.1 SARP family transcriptional regulator [Amycolatopsis regifaucium]SFJ33729.1 Transcriptional regulatory protein, C terminal [Amycolatopsis regifaucium]